MIRMRQQVRRTQTMHKKEKQIYLKQLPTRVKGQDPEKSDRLSVVAGVGVMTAMVGRLRGRLKREHTFLTERSRTQPQRSVQAVAVCIKVRFLSLPLETDTLSTQHKNVCYPSSL